VAPGLASARFLPGFLLAPRQTRFVLLGQFGYLRGLHPGRDLGRGFGRSFRDHSLSFPGPIVSCFCMARRAAFGALFLLCHTVPSSRRSSRRSVYEGSIIARFASLGPIPCRDSHSGSALLHSRHQHTQTKFEKSGSSTGRRLRRITPWPTTWSRNRIGDHVAGLGCPPRSRGWLLRGRINP
jgi:hypothetical protein